MSKSASVMEAPPRDSLLPFIESLCESAGAWNAGWQLDLGAGEGQPWIQLRHAREVFPAQGWKLHVSASSVSAHEVLRRALPILLAQNARFKVAASLHALNALNEGRGQLSQVGKFITVYPRNDAQAVQLAVALDDATRGLRGPAVPSDRVLKPGSLVYYRFGGFTPRSMQTPLGEVVSVLVAPDGTLEADRREPFYQAPVWATDPFEAAGVAVAPPAAPVLFAERFLVTGRLHRSARGDVLAAFDMDEARRCVLKQALRDAALSPDARDATDRLRREAETLRRLAPDPRFPAVYDFFEQSAACVLVMEEVAGRTLEQHVLGPKPTGRLLSESQIRDWGRQLAAILQTIHDTGLVYRDLKSPNVIITPEGRVRLLDFELAFDTTQDARPPAQGTRGYISPQQAAGEIPTPADDIYGLGALLYYMATGAEPSQAPRPLETWGRPVRLLNPAISPALESVIRRCLAPDSAQRFASAADVADALAAKGPASFTPSTPESRSSLTARESAQRLGETLCRAARPAPGGHGLHWVGATNTPGKNLPSRDLGMGSGGATLALAELTAQFDVPEFTRVLGEAARWLCDVPRPAERPLPGLYVGEAGSGAALLRAGQVLGRPDLIAAATASSRWVAAQPFASPDLYNGTAGRLRFHLWLWDETGDTEALQAARDAGDALVRQAEAVDDDNGLGWRVPLSHQNKSDAPLLGYAHGAAGIADALLELYEVTQDTRLLETVQGAAHWLIREARPTLDDDSGLGWPPAQGARTFAAFWCHGSAGIGQFFLRAARLDVVPEAAGMAERAARTVAQATRWSCPAQCHGLSGSIEFLLDLYQQTREAAYLDDARTLARLLDAFASERDGGLIWPSESPTVFSPDYMTGYAGVAVCLLRLADPERLPRQLSRAGFRSTHSFGRKP